MLAILKLLFNLALAWVVLTFILRLYEWRNLTPAERGDVGERLAPWLAGTIGVCWEFFTTMVVIFLTPFGWFDTDPDDLPPVNERPIIFVPGLLGNRAAFWMFKRYFNKRGHAFLFTVNLGPYNGSLRHFSSLVGERVNEVLAKTGQSKVDLVAHGVGGMAARLYVKTVGQDKVANLVTFGTAHQGSRLAVLLGGRANHEIRPGDPFLKELNADVAAELNQGPRYVNIFSSFDNVILPPINAMLPGGENHRLEYLGHTALFFSSQVREICGRVIDGEPTPHPLTYHSEFPNE